LALAACGGSTKTVTVSSSNPTPTAAASTPTAASTSTTTAAPPECSSIASTPSYQGPCTISGGTFTVANRGSKSRLDTVAVKVVDVKTTQSVSNGSSITANAHGTFVIVTIAVTNRTTSPQTFDESSSSSQGALLIAGNRYAVSFEAENTADPQSFVTNNNAIQPGETRTGTIDFDVPSDAAKKVSTRGVLLIADFGENTDSAQHGAILKLFQS
jgi:hypothetical protein